MNLSIDDFDYELPSDLIAQQPSETRSGSRLLCVGTTAIADRLFSELPQLLAPGDLLVFNDTRVIKARLAGEKSSGGRAEVLIQRGLSERETLAQGRASKPPRAGSAMRAAESIENPVVSRQGEVHPPRFPAGGPGLEPRPR